MKSKTRLGMGAGVILGLCVGAGALLPPSALGQEGDAFESSSPAFEKMQMRLWKDSFLSRQLGSPEEFRTHVYAGEFVTFNDNIYLQEDDRKSDVIWTTLAGLDLRLERLDLYDFRFAGNYRDRNYHNYNDADSSAYDLTPSFNWQANPMLRLSLDGAFSKSVSPLIDEVVGGGSIEQYNNGGGIKLQITPTDFWGIDLQWRLNDRRYRDSVYDGLEYMQNTVAATPFYMLSEKTRLGMQLTYGRNDYHSSERNEPEWVEGRLTLDYDPNPKWMMHLDAGYQDREYDHSGTVVKDTADFNGLVFLASSTYKYSEKWSGTVSVLRTPQEASSDASNFFMYTRGGVMVAYNPIAPLKIEAAVFTDWVEPSNGDDSQRYGGSLGVSWSFCEWSGVGVSYQYTLNDAEYDGGNYKNRLISLGAWVTF